MRKKTLTDEQLKQNRLIRRRKWVSKNMERIREYNKKWIKNNPDKARLYRERFYSKNPNFVKEHNKKYRLENKLKISIGNKKYRIKNRDILIKKSKENRDKLKLRVYNHYSNFDIKCNCCGERHIEFLSIDHVNNDGAEHRRTQQHGMVFYTWIKRNNFPTGFQILCFNCNWSKAVDKEHLCIHQKERVVKIIK